MTRSVVVVSFISLAAGYGQFGAVAALGDVAKAFGHVVSGTSIVEQAGLSGTVLGVGLAVLRLASLGGLPLAAVADRWGRHGTLVAWCVLGLAATMLAAASPSYWWFVAIFALGRPLLSATAALAQVVVAELSKPAARAMALALVTAGYGLGAGLNALTHSALRGIVGFRGLFLTAGIPLVIVVAVAKRFPEPIKVRSIEEGRPRFGSVGPGSMRRLLKVMVVIAATSAVSGPASSFVYLYAENVVHLPKGIESAMVVLSALTGLAGLLLGRRVADEVGRRPAIALGITGIGLFSLLLYSGGQAAVVAGFLLGVFATGFLAPGGAAFTNELFATEVRASAAGWGIVASVLGGVVGLVVFGLIADRSGSFEYAALAALIAVVPALAFLAALPESRGARLAGTLGSEPD
jgi:YNFM family putative membrane transporter